MMIINKRDRKNIQFIDQGRSKTFESAIYTGRSAAAAFCRPEGLLVMHSQWFGLQRVI